MSKQDNHWFSHSKNESMSPRQIALRQQYGVKGYAHWWMLMELLRDQPGYKYSVEEEYAYAVLARRLEEITTEETKQFIHDCIHKFKLLKLRGGYIFSEEMTGQMRALDTKRKQLKENGKKGAKVRHGNALANNELVSGAIATPKPPLSKERIEENRKEDNTTEEEIRAENITTHNTEQEETTTTNTTTGTCNTITLPPPPLVEEIVNSSNNADKHLHTVTPIIQLKETVLADAKFKQSHITYGYIQSEEQLAQWLTLFNRWLVEQGKTQKTLYDYRTHFNNWFKQQDKLADPAKDYVAKPVKATYAAPQLTLQEVLARKEAKKEARLMALKAQ